MAGSPLGGPPDPVRQPAGATTRHRFSSQSPNNSRTNPTHISLAVSLSGRETFCVTESAPHRPVPRWPTGRPSRWPLLLLAASLGLVVLTTVVAVLASRKHAATTAQLLRDYASFAAWSYSQRLAQELEEGAWVTLNPIQHSEPHAMRGMPAAADLVGYRRENLIRCRCAGGVEPATYFRYRLGGDTLQAVGAPIAAADSLALTRQLTALVRGPGGRRNGFVALAPAGMASFGLMPTVWGDTMVYGFTVDSAGLAAAATRVLREAPLLPSALTRGSSNLELLVLEVSDTTGRVLHRDARWPGDLREWPFIAAESLPPWRGGLVARLSVRPEAAAQLLSGGFPWSPLPPLLLVGLLGVGSVLVAVLQLRRDGQLARQRSDFVAAASHELRTPLAQLRLFLDTLRLKRYDTPEEEAWLVGHLARETTRLEHLVENVLLVTRLERGAPHEAVTERLALDREVAESVAAFQPLAASRQVEVVTDLAPETLVHAERGPLRQVVLNLLDNAVKFGPVGQRVSVRVAREGNAARLTVTDQGPGVPAAERERIWQPYVRGDGAAAASVGGSGIGLAIVREIVARWGGTGDVLPDGPGATFEIRLPLQ